MLGHRTAVFLNRSAMPGEADGVFLGVVLFFLANVVIVVQFPCDGLNTILILLVHPSDNVVATGTFLTHKRGNLGTHTGFQRTAILAVHA